MKRTRKPRPEKPLTPVSGTVRVVQPFDFNGKGRIVINGVEYGVEQLFELDSETFELCGYRLTKPDGTTYDVDVSAPGAWTCDCPDRTFHPEREGGCKHMAALAVLLRSGKL